MGSTKEVAKRWISAVGSGDAAVLRELMTENAIWELMGTSVLAGERTVDHVAALAGQLHQATKNGIKFSIRTITAEGDRVSVEFVGSSELVTGAAYNNVYHLLFHFRDGAIFHVREYSDSKTIDAAVGPLLAQAGQ